MTPDPLVGRDLAGYRIEALVGRGGMSRVYRAQQRSIGRAVALKLLAPELAENEEFRSRFLAESHLAATIEHPNILPVYDAGEADGQLYLAMRLVEGSDLRALLERDGRLAPVRALAICAQVAAALDAAHARGLVHRDVKPGNILLTGDDHAYLADFGIAKSALARRELTRTGVFIGTLDYASPEQVRNEPLTGATDRYALGCVLYQCLTGQVPFDRQSEYALMQAHLTETPPRPSERGFPAPLDVVIATALAKEPDERYRSAGRLVEAARAAFVPGARVPTVARPAAPAVAATQLASTVALAAGPPLAPTQPAAGGARLAWIRSGGALLVSAVVIAAVVVAIQPSWPQTHPSNPAGASKVGTPASPATSSTVFAASAAPTTTSCVGSARPTSPAADVDPNPSLIARVAVGRQPVSVALNPVLNRAYVTNFEDQTISVVATDTNSVLTTIRVGSKPGRVTVSRDGRRAYVASVGDNSVTLFDTTTNRVSATVPVAGTGWPVMNADDRYVLVLGQRGLEVLDGHSMLPVRTVEIGSGSFSGPVAHPTFLNLVYLSNATDSTLRVIDIAIAREIQRVVVGKKPSEPLVSADGARVFVPSDGDGITVVCVCVVCATSHDVVARGVGPASSSWLAIAPNGSRLFAPANRGISVLDPATNQVLGSVELNDLAFRGLPKVNPDGSRVFQQSARDSVYVVSGTTQRLLATINTPSPWELALSVDGRRLYVVDATSSLSIYSLR